MNFNAFSIKNNHIYQVFRRNIKRIVSRWVHLHCFCNEKSIRNGYKYTWIIAIVVHNKRKLWDVIIKRNSLKYSKL